VSRMDYRNWMGNAAIILAVIASTSLVGWGVVRDYGKTMPQDPYVVAEKKMASEPALAIAPANQQQLQQSRAQQQYSQQTAQDYTNYQTTPQGRTTTNYTQGQQSTRTTTGTVRQTPTQGTRQPNTLVQGQTQGRGRGGRGGGGGAGFGPGGGGFATDPTGGFDPAAGDVGAAPFDPAAGG